MSRMRAAVSAAIAVLMLGCSTTDDIALYYITGYVLDANGGVVTGAQVTIIIDDDGPPKRYVGWSRYASGEFRIPDVPYGHHAIIRCVARGFIDYQDEMFINDPADQIQIILRRTMG
jgi:hypothetical protein